MTEEITGRVRPIEKCDETELIPVDIANSDNFACRVEALDEGLGCARAVDGGKVAAIRPAGKRHNRQ
jgi:hypothetical protein